MSKPSRGGMRNTGSKKKQKRRPDQRSIAQIQPSDSNQQPVQPQAEAVTGSKAGGGLQFRPRARENSAAIRSVAARAGASSRAFQQVVDYSYVYTDLRIIGGLSVVLFGGLVALSFILR